MFINLNVWDVLSTALNLKEIPYDIKPINLMNGEQHSNEFGKINPIKKIPVLHIDNLTLIESVSILGQISNYYPITIIMTIFLEFIITDNFYNVDEYSTIFGRD